MDRPVAEVIAAADLYRDLTPEEIAETAAGIEVRRFAPGEPLMRQGALSDGAYLIATGAVSVTIRLPGGGEAAVAELSPGALVGEMALLTRGGRRTATARAVTAVEALFTDQRYFEAGLHLLRPASLKVLRRLGLGIADRLRATRIRGRALVEAEANESQLRAPPKVVDAGAPPAYDARAFLPILPCLREFSAADLDILCDAARFESVRRGASLIEEGQSVDAPRLVVRGALLLGQRHKSHIHQLAVLGPGRFAGVAPVLEDAAAASAILAAEDSTLLAFDPDRFRALWGGHDRLALRLLDAVNADLVQSLIAADNHLARLTTEARVRELAR